MNKKMWIIGLTVLITAIGILAAVSTPDGSTRENREKLIQDIPHGDNWKIAVEQTFEDHIIAGIYSSGNRYGIAVFEPVGKENYRLQTYHSRDLDRTFIHSFYLNEEWYDFVWLYRPSLDYAEITYTLAGVEQDTLRHEAENMEIFIHPSPIPEFSGGVPYEHTLHVIYYDNDGNPIE